MYILTAKRGNVIIGIGPELDYMSNGYPRLIDINVAFPIETTNVHEVAEVPTEVREGQYCYDTEKGFYENPDWVAPYDAETHITNLEQQITDLQMALCDVYEMKEA
ncbi:MAG TPA: hypothetical protein DCW90_13370 [Lachnospiraceae bacterium]|nr:hypothetical protein [Lachnospiraceae bacterium]